MISISSLIYKSTLYADSVYQSLYKYTPMLGTSKCEFYFIANDATEEVLEHLKKKNYPHFIQNNIKRTTQELLAMGYGWPEYIHRVYRGWNRAIMEARGDLVCLVNSDHLFSPNWLENLAKNHNEKRIVCSSHMPGGSFGTSLSTFQEDKFLQSCKEISKASIKQKGAFMPALFLRSQAIGVGLYPEGNIPGSGFRDIIEYGDANFFRKMRERFGASHVTALDSLVYHLQGGEMRCKL